MIDLTIIFDIANWKADQELPTENQMTQHESTLVRDNNKTLMRTLSRDH